MILVDRGGPFPVVRVPKYLHDAGVPWAIMDFGLEPTAIAVADVTNQQHKQLAAQSDVIAVPSDLTAQVGNALAATRDALEAINLPSEWVTAGHTWVNVLRMVTGAIQVAQRVHGILRVGGRLFPSGVTLDTRYADLSPGVRDALLQTAHEFGIDYSMLGPNSTLRAILRQFGTQLPPVSLLGVMLG
jgi:hypothetical protein